MKNVNAVFTDEEHQKLVKAKRDLNWHDFIMTLVSIADLITEDMKRSVNE